MAMSSTMTTEGTTSFLPFIRLSAVMPAAQAVTCPEGKEYPSSNGEPTYTHHSRNCSTVSNGRGRAMVSLRIIFVMSAPQHTAPNTHTPVSRSLEKHMNISASRKKIIPFSPRKVMTFISGVSTAPRAVARECIRERMALS